ncbi:PAS domain-containing protein [Mesorhizobium sp.]|uniref:PAS domain-containing protein n=1 Tax=Mesorhizobium sp. TaxID=1871066 RepID=UPI0025F8D05D|nr:PAS domain-containing protein [Mesorhizobium sp.]
MHARIAEAEVEGFRKDLGPFVVAAETTRMAMVFTDAKEHENPIIFVNDAFLELTGYREEVLGQSFNFLMARGTDPDSLARIGRSGEAQHRGAAHLARLLRGRCQYPDFTSAFGGVADIVGAAADLVPVANDPSRLRC